MRCGFMEASESRIFCNIRYSIEGKDLYQALSRMEFVRNLSIFGNRCSLER
jgi:hypothetical protein